MSEIIARCGNRCDLCPLFSENFSAAEAGPINKALYKYHHGGVGSPPRYARACDGCLGSGYVAREGCGIRRCVQAKGLGTCAECEGLFCSLLETDIAVVEGALAKHRKTMPKQDYERYFQPFMIRQMLLDLRVGRRSTPDATRS